MAGEDAVDEHLVAVLNEILDALYQAKQASWSASTSPAREALSELVSFLIDQSRCFMVAEERLGGRSPAVGAPSSHQRGNLIAEAEGDHDKAVSFLAHRLVALVDNARLRAAAIPNATEARMLVDFANELEARVGRLQARLGDG